jgi:RimJ/RimL family protein N-acetyltransferase
MLPQNSGSASLLNCDFWNMNTSKITIEPISAEHASDIQRLATDPVIAEMTRIPHPYPANGAISFIEKSVEGRANGTDFVFAIKEDGILVGVCGLHCHDESRSNFELGYWIGRPYWGKGIATEAVSQLVACSLTSLHLPKLYADCLERNAASQRVLEKNRFHPVSRRQNTDPKWKPDEIIIRYEISES